MPTVRIYLNKAPIGWRYCCEVGQLRIDGWRPKKSWARTVANRRSARLGSQFERINSHS